jgi:hypothetical protein
MLYQAKKWIRTDVHKALGFSVSDTSSLRGYFQQMMNNPFQFAKYNSLIYGTDWMTTTFIKLLLPLFTLVTDYDHYQWNLCLEGFITDDHADGKMNDPTISSCIKNSGRASTLWT